MGQKTLDICDKILKAVETLLLLTVLNYRSNWDSGKTWKTSLRELSELTGISVRYLRDKLSDLMDNGWISRLSRGTNTGSRYEIQHHNCSRNEIPTDRNGNPLKFAVPRGKGGILERLFNGDISWKSALLWIVLKVYSDWKTGKTIPSSIQTLAKWLGMSPQTVSDCFSELTKAGLIKRLTPKHVAGIYQLYPKPNAKPKGQHRRRKPKGQKRDRREMKIDGNWRLSYNELWRVNVETGEIQTRKSRKKGLWRDLTLGDTIPKAIARDFDACILVYSQLTDGLRGVTDTAQSVTDTAQSVTDDAHPSLESGYNPSLQAGS